MTSLLFGLIQTPVLNRTMLPWCARGKKERRFLRPSALREPSWFSRLFCLLAVSLLLPTTLTAEDFTSNPEVTNFIEEMVREHGYDRQRLQTVFAGARYKQSIIDAISRPAEKRLNWKEYQGIFLTAERIEQGKHFLRKYRSELARAEKEYGVPPEIVAAIIGVETFYGTRMGSYRVIDALTTLSFSYPARSSFFKSQLQDFLLITREEQRDEFELLGSYAGAMGFGQFIPSSYRAYAIDFDGDGARDIWTNVADAIGSVANYLGKHGWRKGEAITEDVSPVDERARVLFDSRLEPSVAIKELVAVGIKLERTENDEKISPLLFDGIDGDEYWIGYFNFYVITRYNHSKLYAMAVYQLSRNILS